MNNRWMLSRRELLRGFGAAGLASFLPSDLLYAQEAIPPRLIVVHVPEGMWKGAPRPSAGASNLGNMLQALQPHQAKVLVLNNLSIATMNKGPGGDGHHRAVPHMFTCTEMKDENNAGGVSLDQHIAKAIGGQSRLGSLALAVRIVYTDTNSKCLWSGAGRVVPAIQSPWDAMTKVFGSGTPTAPAMPSNPTGNPAAKAPDMRRSVLDRALKDINALRPQLSAPDRLLLDSYHDSLRDIEMRMANGIMPLPSSCAAPDLGAKINVGSEANYPAIGKLQMDLMVAALQCNATRVATLQWGNSNDQCTYSWLGVKKLGHDMAHNNNNCDPSGSKKLQTYTWYFEQAAYLMNKLASIAEGGGSMLDNTLILWASEFGDSMNHSGDNLMWLLMGNAGGKFKSGRVLNCGGRSVADLHTSIANAFGLPDKTFGNPAYCKGPLPDLTV